MCLGTRGGVSNHSFMQTWLGAGTSKQNNHKNRLRVVADAASFLSDKKKIGNLRLEVINPFIQYPNKFNHTLSLLTVDCNGIPAK